MPVSPYITFSGNCAEALAFYEAVLGATVNARLTYAEAPMPPPDGWGTKIMHTEFTILGSSIMGSDTPPGMYQPVAGFRVTLNMDDQNTAKTWFEALSEGGKVNMPLQKTFWASAFGMVTDRFGIPWMINCL
jgi:PhnB protein